ncbi:MAG: hypothetical protein MZV70_63475 [Desulfobacterales bacterium]|nr:hypothetical protein [Desulfobacterales bacterium]
MCRDDHPGNAGPAWCGRGDTMQGHDNGRLTMPGTTGTTLRILRSKVAGIAQAQMTQGNG